MSRGSFFIGLAVVVLLIVGLVSWRLTTNTGDDANAELPSDLTEIFNTASWSEPTLSPTKLNLSANFATKMPSI